jgi:hypothetical protein
MPISGLEAFLLFGMGSVAAVVVSCIPLISGTYPTYKVVGNRLVNLFVLTASDRNTRPIAGQRVLCHYTAHRHGTVTASTRNAAARTGLRWCSRHRHGAIEWHLPKDLAGSPFDGLLAAGLMLMSVGETVVVSFADEQDVTTSDDLMMLEIELLAILEDI